MTLTPPAPPGPSVCRWVERQLGGNRLLELFPISPVMGKDSLAQIAPAETAISSPTEGVTNSRLDRVDPVITTPAAEQGATEGVL